MTCIDFYDLDIHLDSKYYPSRDQLVIWKILRTRRQIVCIQFISSQIKSLFVVVTLLEIHTKTYKKK